jgi:hypothetical protein
MPHIFILAHFEDDYRYLIAINFLVWIGYVPTFIIFFKIICLNVEGVVGFQS